MHKFVGILDNIDNVTTRVAWMFLWKVTMHGLAIYRQLWDYRNQA